MREFLSARHIPFRERNIRQDPEAQAELLRLTGELAVPVVVVGDRHVVGYEPEWLESIISVSSEEASTLPPRDSAWRNQGSMAARPQANLAATVNDLVVRVREELAYNAAKGSGPYRQGMHDGLRFAEEALMAILEQYGGEVDVPESEAPTRRLDA